MARVKLLIIYLNFLIYSCSSENTSMRTRAIEVDQVTNSDGLPANNSRESDVLTDPVDGKEVKSVEVEVIKDSNNEGNSTSSTGEMGQDNSNIDAGEMGQDNSNLNDAYAKSAFLASIPDKTWTQIPNSKMTAVASNMFYDGQSDCCGFGIYAFSGAVKDDQRGIVYFWGGGHGDYYGNEVYEFNIENLEWKRLTEPSPFSKNECASFDDIHILSDGQPKSRHTYDQMVFVPHLNKIWAHGGSVCGSGAGITDLWEFDIATKTWKDLDPGLTYAWNGNLARSAEYDPVTKKIFYFYSQSIKTFDVDSGMWDPMWIDFVNRTERTAVLDPNSRKIVFYGGDDGYVTGGVLKTNEVAVFNVDSKTIEYPAVPENLPKRMGNGWTYDEKNKIFVAYGGYEYTNTDLWYYDVVSNTWFSETISNAPSGMGNIYQRFMYDKVNDVIFFFRSPYEDVWVLKNQSPRP
ncbi:MAG: hypothetical protein R3B45_12745 [Bdellovibrionota bacterium]